MMKSDKPVCATCCTPFVATRDKIPNVNYWVLKPDMPNEGICLANCASSLKTKHFGK